MRCEHELSVGAYVLDALEPDEQLLMARHVQECPACAETVRELEGLPRLLAAVPTPGRAPVMPVPSELAFERFRRSAAATFPRPPRRARWWVTGAAAVLVLVAALATTLVLLLTEPAPTVVEAAHGAVRVTASYLAANDGTKVTIEMDGALRGERCELLAVDRAGHEESAGDWQVSGSGNSEWSGWISFEPGDVERFVVRVDGRTLITLPA
jgi:anti-sigma factor RsiW